MAFSGIADLADNHGTLREPNQIPRETRRSVAAVEVAHERTARRVVGDGAARRR